MKNELAEIVETIEGALQYVREHAKQVLGLSLDEAEVTMRAIRVSSAGARVAWGPVKLGGKVDRANESTFTFKLRPSRGSAALGEATADKLGDAIIAHAAAIASVAEVSSRFRVTSSAVVLGFEVSKEGTIEVVVGGSGASKSSHSIRLQFVPA